MGAVADILSGIKQVILLQENVSRLQREVETLAQDVRRVRDYAGEIDKRVARIEGVMEGFARASNAPRMRKLPKA
jgi:archaellum component FlaC